MLLYVSRFINKNLTVKPIPTVALNEPLWNLPVSNWTNTEVLPTPESPTRMVFKI